MKKLLVFIIAALMVFPAVGCGETKEKTPENTETQVSDNKDTNETAKENASGDTSGSENNTGASGNDEADSNNSGSSNSDAENNFEDSTGEFSLPDIKEQKIIDTDICSVVITGIKDDFFGPKLTAEFKNKSKDCEYLISIKDSYINGVYTPMYLQLMLPAGETAEQDISLSLSDLQKYGLTEITDIELSIEVKDSNASWIDPPEVFETVNIQPKGKDAVKKFVLKDKFVQNVYIDNKYAKVTALSYYQNEIYGYCIDLFIENRTDGNISIKFEDTSVNGKLLDPYVYEVVNKGKCTIARVDWPTSDFAENGISTFEEIKFTLVVANNDNLSDKNFSADEIVLKFN